MVFCPERAIRQLAELGVSECTTGRTHERTSRVVVVLFTIGYSGRFKKDLKIIKKRSEVSFEDPRIFIKELQNTGSQG